VSDLIDLNQGEMGIITLLPTMISPIKELRDISDYVRPMAERKAQRLVVDLPEYLPDTCLDPARLRQIVLNLLENALRHTSQGGTITLRAVKARRSLMVEISDNGCGIAKKDLGRIFDPYPGKRIGDNLDGLGIGLPLCKMLVELHGGTIKVKSQKDKGSIFTFNIPMRSQSLPREKNK
jgi:signal transduction histidine kinase